jgi:molecular chaperone GrpE
MSKPKKNKQSHSEQPDRQEGYASPQEEPQTPGSEAQDQDVAGERDDLLARLQRVSADYANYQKRMARQFEQARLYANEQIMRSLLSVIDDMERALAAAKQNHDADDPLLKGMQLVHDKQLDTLKQFGLGTIEAEGQPFDPDRHQAMMRQPTGDQEPMTVLQVVQKGYTLQGRTLRPAGVIVAVAPEGQDSGEEQDSGSVDVEA